MYLCICIYIYIYIYMYIWCLKLSQCVFVCVCDMYQASYTRKTTKMCPKLDDISFTLPTLSTPKMFQRWMAGISP